MLTTPPGVESALDELATLDLGDARLNARARRLVAALARNPAAGFPAAVATEAEREATYRLLGNARVTLAGLLAPHVAQTAQRAVAHGARPVVALDKTAFVFRGEGARADVPRLGVDRHGFEAMVALAVGRPGDALGVVGIAPLADAPGRGGAATWLRAIEAADAVLGPQRPIYVMDREADSYAVFAGLHQAGRDGVVRVAADRWVREHPTAPQELLPTVLARTPQVLTREVALTRRSGVRKAPEARQRHPPRATRTAELTLRAAALIVPRPPKLATSLPAQLPLHVVQVVEATPPPDVVPVEWWLVTTLPITTPAEVEAVVDHYRARWTIEEYFKALKSGCAYEKRQLESRATLLAALGLLAPLAWRLLALRTAAADATRPATTLFEPDELHVLRAISQDVPLGPTPTAVDALTALARLGGHFPQNGRPGWKVLWTGFQKLLDRVDGYRLAHAELARRPPPPHDARGAAASPRCDQ